MTRFPESQCPDCGGGDRDVHVTDRNLVDHRGRRVRTSSLTRLAGNPFVEKCGKTQLHHELEKWKVR